MTLGLSSPLERELPALGRLHRVRRAEDEEVGDGAERRELLDRLVGRTVLAEADRIVGHDEDDPVAHQRGEADRRPAIVGEDEERAAIGDEPAVERHAVHRRRHAVLAHAPADVAPGEVGRRDVLHVLRLGVVRPGQVGRTADRLRHRRVDHVERHLGRLARRDLRPVGGKLPLVVGDDPVEARAAARRGCAARTRRASRRRPRRGASPTPCATWLALRPAIRQASRISAGTSKGG